MNKLWFNLFLSYLDSSSSSLMSSSLLSLLLFSATAIYDLLWWNINFSGTKTCFLQSEDIWLRWWGCVINSRSLAWMYRYTPHLALFYTYNTIDCEENLCAYVCVCVCALFVLCIGNLYIHHNFLCHPEQISPLHLYITK